MQCIDTIFTFINVFFQEEAEKDLAILDEFEGPKPEKPKQVTAAELRERTLEKYNEIRRKPGTTWSYTFWCH